MIASAAYFGQVMHRREVPRAYRFVYRVFSLLVDIDELDTLDRNLRLFSRNRFNLVTFRDRDFGPRDGSDLRAWAEALLAEHGLPVDGGPIWILCFPRVLGFGFSPLSVWYCHRSDGRLAAVILEVRNTFGEKHQYLLPVDQAGGIDGLHHWESAKAFHVSPFIGPRALYRFALGPPADRVLVRVDEFWKETGQQTGEPDEIGDRERPCLSATWSGSRRALDDRRLLALAVRVPFLGLKIVSLIHWHALRLWLRGVRFHRKPSPPTQEVTLTCPRHKTSGFRPGGD